MGNLGDAFKRAGLVSEADHRRNKHEERVERKKLGRDGLEAKQRKTDDQRSRRRDGARRRDRDRERGREGERQHKSDKARAKDIAKRHAITRGLGGPRRFHYIERDGRIPFLAVQDELGQRLESGECGIVVLGGEVHVLPRDHTEALGSIDSELVRFLAGHDP